MYFRSNQHNPKPQVFYPFLVLCQRIVIPFVCGSIRGMQFNLRLLRAIPRAVSPICYMIQGADTERHGFHVVTIMSLHCHPYGALFRDMLHITGVLDDLGFDVDVCLFCDQRGNDVGETPCPIP